MEVNNKLKQATCSHIPRGFEQWNS